MWLVTLLLGKFIPSSGNKVTRKNLRTERTFVSTLSHLCLHIFCFQSQTIFPKKISIKILKSLNDRYWRICTSVIWLDAIATDWLGISTYHLIGQEMYDLSWEKGSSGRTPGSFRVKYLSAKRNTWVGNLISIGVLNQVTTVLFKQL